MQIWSKNLYYWKDIGRYGTTDVLHKERSKNKTWYETNQSFLMYHFLVTPFTPVTRFAGVWTGRYPIVLWQKYKTSSSFPLPVNISHISQATWSVKILVAYVIPRKSSFFCVISLSLSSSEDEVFYKQPNPDVNSMLYILSIAKSFVLSWFENSNLNKVKINVSGNILLTKRYTAPKSRDA